MRFFTTSLVVLLGVFGWGFVAQAFSISPLRYVLTIAPGKEQLVMITLTNTEATGATFRVRSGGVRQDEQGKPVFGTNLDVAEQWLQPQNTTYYLAPKESKKITLTMAVPPGVEPGTHTSAIVVGKEVTTTDTVGLTTELAALVTTHVAGVVHEALLIERWETHYDEGTKQLVGQLELKNTGTVSLALKGGVVLMNLAGKEVATTALMLGNTVLPGTKRVISTTIPVALSVGPTKALVRVVYGLSQTPVVAENTLWHLPKWLYIAVIGGFVCILAIRHLFKKKK